VECFLERDHDVGFDIAPSLGSSRPLPKTSTAKTSRPASAAEKLLEEIAEASSAEFEFHAAAVPGAVATESATRLLRIPSGRRLKSARLIPVRAQLVVFFSLLRIAEDLVGFIQLLELFFRRCLVLIDVGMVFARQLSERLANLIVAGGLRDAERLVIISKLNSHLSAELLRGKGSTQGALAAAGALRYVDRVRDLGRMLAILGGVITIVGLALWTGFGAGWLGRLPGDIRIERGNSAFYFPIVTCIVISIVVTLLMSLFRR
jgi:hypothetical protein